MSASKPEKVCLVFLSPFQLISVCVVTFVATFLITVKVPAHCFIRQFVVSIRGYAGPYTVGFHAM